MTRMRFSAGLAVGAALSLLGACGTMGMGGMDDDGGLSAALTGAAEVPGPGDPDGGGSATVRFDSGVGARLCYDLTVTGIDAATMAHIHRGAGGTAGPVVVPLTAPASGFSSGCVDVTAALSAEILANPGGFYANVHNAAYPGGAVRGQLSN